ncbi:MAG: acyl-[ACP]--phospholipid O-acyltransferase [Nitrospirota bacterium]|nr:acyl-[ACP]--phospholipid O-acyltransferase [Nitrospirota bacterium]MDP2383070.1 acyl-[ACP]--phospholipid O-acyltransferase [Nitrospirota bacterium]MDP3595813.1 acyl-[ACP]--phospholipid O-acyltransferase [Nitrospirota bacterium]
MAQEQKHPLRGLLIAQFCGAFNDNAWKLMVALLAIRQATAQMAPGPELETAAQTQTAITFIIFTLPLVLLSLVGGTLADRLSKRTVIIAIKVVEVFLMGAGTIALWVSPGGGILPLIVLCGMGVHSALFSPSKYGILPELIPHERLASGNGLLEMWTFAAILTGTAAGGFLLQTAGDQLWLAPLALAALSIVGLIAAFAVPHVSPARASGGVGATIRGAWAAIQSERLLRLAIPGEIFFWTIASLFAQNVLVYAKAVLHLSDALSGLPLTVLSVGIGLGAMLVGRLSQNRVEYGLIPLGATGVFIALTLIGAFTPALTGTFLLMGLLGISSAFIFVPLNAILQWKSPPDRRGAVISFSNTCVFTGILLGSLAGGALAHAGLSTSGIFLVTAGITVGGTAWALWLLPDACLRLVLVIVTNTLYRLRIVGQDHVPQSGGALLVPNHVSFIDGFLLIASLDRPVRFIVDEQYANQRLFKPFMTLLGVIPISSHGGLRVILRALRAAGDAIDKGEIVCLFPEGQITRTGTLLPFRRGFERIMKGKTAPIIPVHLDRVWGSIFSFNHGRFLSKIPDQIPYPVTVSFGAPLPADTPAHELRTQIRSLGEAAWRLRKHDRRPLHRTFIHAMRRHPFRLAMADQQRPHVSSLQALIGSIVLARALTLHWRNQQNIGILLPPTVVGALVNVAAPLCGKTSVNLNYTVGKAGLEAAVRLAGLRTIVTSRAFAEKAKLDLPDGPTIIWLEDLAKQIGTGQKLVASLLALCAPVRIIELACGQRKPLTIDDLATIIFSSGSTGDPKGVMLSHFSVDANAQGASQVLHLYQDERVLGILPFFHSFGYLVFWFVMSNNATMVFHPSPLDVAAIGELVRRYRITFLVTTPTFLQLYQRRCTPEQFSSLRVVLTGAEKLPARVSQAFQDQFGITPIEGYGVTECSPVVAVSCPDFRAAGYYQPASRRGTVGQPLPGVSVQIVDPDSFAPMPPGTPGMLLVRGPNVMNGYIGREDLTATVMRDGWYITGDIAMQDDDGFLTITDRLSRFSKIGGEMVPHGKVEEALHLAAGLETQTFAVTGIPDEKKGEQLAVLHLLDEAQIPGIVAKLTANGLPNLFIPSRANFVKVDALPLLGTGKMDLRGLKRIAMERLSGKG